MKYLKYFEEIVIQAVKGNLQNLFASFTKPYLDIINEIKKLIKDNKLDPKELKNLIINNFNESIDNIVKEIPKLKGDNTEGDIKSLVDIFIKKINEITNAIDKDFDENLGKNSTGAKSIMKCILIGSKDINWSGVVGLLVDPDYKYSKTGYENKLSFDTKGKTGDESVKILKDSAVKFFENLKKDINDNINKKIGDKELEKIYGEPINTTDYKVGDNVNYKRKAYDDERKPEEQKSLIANGIIKKIDGDNYTIYNKVGKIEVEKKKSDILGKVQYGQNAQRAAEELGKIKDDEVKMGLVTNFAKFIEDDNNKSKIDKITKII